ncbi:NlpC/P60 family protein [Peptostreptococcaceae bacterium AS15]|nr:NlpC/P60 family protein [[Eubacterium] yurii subsp. margaretiae ATCC 43715]EJP20069.1 NlpC/P60 family protein [Peptostreptococcaceae bacterium AS15]
MKKTKLLLATVLTLGIATFSFTNAYADNETTEVNPANAKETVEVQQGEVIADEDLEKLLSANEEQVKIQETEVKKEEQVAVNLDEKASSTADKIIVIGKSKLGSPYVFGSTGPSSFDCSGFTSYVFAQAGISLPRVASSQAYGGKRVSKANLQKGDLVFFNTFGGISHVGIYIGSGNFIHASSYNSGVTISNLNDGYYGPRYVTASRYL